jgi:hypothetical protein
MPSGIQKLVLDTENYWLFLEYFYYRLEGSFMTGVEISKFVSPEEFFLFKYGCCST